MSNAAQASRSSSLRLVLAGERTEALAREAFEADHACGGGRALQVVKAAEDDPADGAAVETGAEFGRELLGDVGDVGGQRHAFSPSCGGGKEQGCFLQRDRGRPGGGG